MSIKHLGPSLLASEMILPLDRVASYVEKVNEWGKPLAVTLYPISHVVNDKEVLFLAMLATDNRKNIFYLDLMLIPMMLRLAVQNYGGKPYGIGIWNTPFLRNLYTQDELKQLVRYKKKVDPAGILNSGKFFTTSGRWGLFKKPFFRRISLTSGSPLLSGSCSNSFPFSLRRRCGFAHPWFPKSWKGFEGYPLLCPVRRLCGRCPVYRATGDETLTAKGKLLTIKKALEKGELELSKAMSSISASAVVAAMMTARST